MTFIQRLWYRPAGWHWVWYWPLLLLSLIYWLITTCRRAAYRRGWLHVTSLRVPVIVVGNITVGGSGKTPFTLWLVQHLRQLGFRPGIVSRGYGGNSQEWPRRVLANSDPREVGDEPVLLAQRLGCPVAVAPERPAAAMKLLEEDNVDIIVADDGLQHYALGRNIEIGIVDGGRSFGNGRLLPAGPLREPVSRLQRTNLIVINGGHANAVVDGLRMHLVSGPVIPVSGGEGKTLADFAGRPVHAVAGIGNPDRFFDSLRTQGLELIEHRFPDHHAFRAEDIIFPDNGMVLMTEKDAVKCRGFSGPQHWYVSVDAEFDAADIRRIDVLLQRLRAGS